MAKFYRVVSSQLVYSYALVEADSEDDALELAYEISDELDWKEFHYGEWELEEAEEV